MRRWIKVLILFSIFSFHIQLASADGFIETFSLNPHKISQLVAFDEITQEQLKVVITPGLCVGKKRDFVRVFNSRGRKIISYSEPAPKYHWWTGKKLQSKSTPLEYDAFAWDGETVKGFRLWYFTSKIAFERVGVLDGSSFTLKIQRYREVLRVPLVKKALSCRISLNEFRRMTQ